MTSRINIDDFHNVEIMVGEILAAERIEGSNKLLKLRVSFGDEERQVLSGIAAYFPDPAVLVGRRTPFVTNLEPRQIMGLESQAMLLATGGGETPLSLFETSAPAGAKVR
jgi:methionine--tRNA ligase beta chain